MKRCLSLALVWLSMTLAWSPINAALPIPAGNPVEIHDIQGTGANSMLVGTQVSTRNNIVTAVRSLPGADDNGFYIQTPDGAADANMATSQGVFVLTGTTLPTVAIGDAINVVATVRETSGMTQLAAPLTVTELSAGNPLPLAIAFGTGQILIPSKNPAALSCGTTNFECLEGMRVQVNDGRVVRANLRRGSDVFAEVFVSAYGERGVREPGMRFGQVLTPGDNAAAGVWDGNPDIFELDVDEVGGAPAAPGLTAGTRFVATGVIGYSSGDYEFYPTEFEVTNAPTMPRPVRIATSQESTIAAFNLQRLCDTVNNVGQPGITTECNGPLPPTAAELNTKLDKLARTIGSLLRLPTVIAVSEVENEAVLAMLRDRIENLFGAIYNVYVIDGNDPSGIDVGLMTRSDRVRLGSVTGHNAFETYADPAGGTPRLFDSPQLVLDATIGGRRMLVMANHLKARTNVEAGAAGNSDRAKRFAQAQSTAALVQSFQTMPATVNVPMFVVGNFNAYQFTDGYSDLVGVISGTYDNAANIDDLPGGQIVSPPLLNAVTTLPADEQYSFLLTERFGAIQGYTAVPGDNGRDVPTPQALDHALLNTRAQDMLVAMQFARGNLDAPDEIIRLDTTGPLGSSDHDGFVLFLRNEGIFSNGFE